MTDVIIIEDEIAHAELIRRAFETREGKFDVRVVGNLADARRRIAAQSPDLVITDLMLPDGRGIELVAEQSGEEFPVVVMTSHGDEKIAVEAIKAGALDYVVKTAETLSSMPHVAERALREWRQRAELRRAQQQLRQAQKMEAIGNLTSGIAHDFNNLLMGITGCSEVALNKLGADNDARRYIQEIKKAALRGSSLTRQLLAFTRKREVDPRVVGLNGVVRDAESLLRPLVSEDIDFQVALSDESLAVHCDPGQMEQVLVNLVVNARDAMPAGGSLRVTTEALQLDPGDQRLVGQLEPGEYVRLAVSDTGTGIDDETLEHIFEPFFTTKEVGQGTGLGLSTIYGIVKGSGGEVVVNSEINRGSTFSIYLPRTYEQPKQRSEPLEVLEQGHGEVVLVVEDDSLVRMTVRGYLERSGYHVIEAEDGAKARHLAEQAHTVDLLITDMILPGLKGPEIAREILELHPDIAVLYMSAHSPEQLRADGRIGPTTDSLQKPFSKEKLLTEVQNALTPAAEQAREIIDGEPPAELAGGDQPRVLLVEDHDLARMTTRELLEDEGFRVVDADSGARAVELARAHCDSLRLVISDVKLPDVDGVELVRQVRHACPDIAVILTSGVSPDDPRVASALREPQTSFIQKPIAFDELIRRIAESLAPASSVGAKAAE